MRALLCIARIWLLLILSLFAGDSRSNDSFKKTHGDDLTLVCGPDGFISTWLSLGPFKVPRAKIKQDGTLANHDPLKLKGSGAMPMADAREAGGAWKVSSSRTYQTVIKKVRSSVMYYAAVLKSDEARRLYLSIGSSGGVEVSLNGVKLLARDRSRKGSSDTDLVDLSLAKGDNLLLIRTWKKRGRWTFSARLMDKQFRRPRGLSIVLPGAGKYSQKVLRKNGLISLERYLNLEKGYVETFVWLDFNGGMPVSEPKEIKIVFNRQGSTPTLTKILPMGVNSDAYELLGHHIFDGDKAPISVHASMGKIEFNAEVGFRMKDVARLSETWNDLGRAQDNHGPFPRTTIESIKWRIAHLKKLIEAGDRDYRYIGKEIKNTSKMAHMLATGKDPYYGDRGRIQRRGYRSAVDGKLHSYALYVPPGWRESRKKKFGLVVSLHGLNSAPIKAITTLMGVPLAEGETKEKRERSNIQVNAAPMFAVAPEGFGNSGYVSYGERDVLEVIARVTERYPIDTSRIYITGASMGGTGAASIPLHYPDKFTATAPLCGYHSLSEYSSLRGIKLRPWEKHLAEFRSNSQWAHNGRHMPAHIVHGTKDGLRYSKVLVNQLKLKGYDVSFETPIAGHNVWDETYKDNFIFKHFARYKFKARPRRISFRTSRLRYNRARWLRVDGASVWSEWSSIEGVWSKDAEPVVTTDNVAAFSLMTSARPQNSNLNLITVDDQKIELEVSGEGPVFFSKRSDRWVAAKPLPCAGLCKRPKLAGPIDDVFNEPLLFVYGTADPDETRLAIMIIDRLRKPRGGVTIDWPVKADVEVSPKDLQNYSIVLVGTERGNSLLARMATQLPIRSSEGSVTAGGRRFEGDNVAAAFIYPNPLNPDRYVVVHTGATSRALFYAAHLPDLLGDYLIYDASDWTWKRGLVLKDREVLTGGFFDEHWKLPLSIDLEIDK